VRHVTGVGCPGMFGRAGWPRRFRSNVQLGRFCGDLFSEGMC